MLGDSCVFVAAPASNYTTRMMDGSFATEIFVPKLEEIGYMLRIRSTASQSFFQATALIISTFPDPKMRISLNEVPDKLIYTNHGDNETLTLQLTLDQAFEASATVSDYFVTFDKMYGGINSRQSIRILASDNEITHWDKMLIASHRNPLDNNVDLVLKGITENFNPVTDAGVYCLDYFIGHVNLILHIGTCTAIVTPDQTHRWTPKVTMSSHGCNPCHLGDDFTIAC